MEIYSHTCDKPTQVVTSLTWSIDTHSPWGNLVLYGAIICWICGGRSGTEKGFSPSDSVSTSQYNSTDASYSFIHAYLML